jgi:hypothetical protein
MSTRRTNRSPIVSILVLCIACVTASEGRGANVSETARPTITMQGDLPAPGSINRLYDEFDLQQATQAYLWALPLVSVAQWQAAQAGSLGAGNGDLVVYDTFVDKLGILTPNATTPYVIAFVDLNKTGPLVIDMPAGHAAGGVNDAWQREIASVGEAGPDQGKGARYLLLPPGQTSPADAQGLLPIQATTMNVLIGFRALDPDPKAAQALIEKFRLYPYADRANPPPTRVITPKDKRWYGGQPDGMDYWRRLHAIIQTEPVAERDRFFMAMLASLGIEKGKPFQPTARQTGALQRGAALGANMAKAMAFAKRAPEARVWPDREWKTVLEIDDPSQRVANFDQLNERSAWFYEAVTNSKSMVSNTPGVGQAYLGVYADKAGQWLDGGKNYRLRVPANAPAKNFWSITLYDTQTRSYVDGPAQASDRSSRMPLAKNSDGSVDLYFGPKAPAGKVGNWVQTVPGRHWFAYFRLYGPTEAYFDRSWKLGNLERSR